MWRGWLYGLTAALCIVILGGALFLNLSRSVGTDPVAVIGADRVALCREVQAALEAEKFDVLDRMGREFATLKDHFVGGREKLTGFYDFTGMDGCTADFCTARPVQPENIRKLQNWLNREPGNPVARGAMALNWYYYAWVGRSCANWADITFDQWQIYFDRLRIARSYLEGVDRSTNPQYYVILMNILCESGGPRARLDALYAEGHTAFPAFYELTAVYARTLDQSWFGSNGDVQWLADKLLLDPGGDTGVVAYSFVAEQLAPLIGHERFLSQSGLSWEKIKRAFSVRNKLFGLSVHDWNAYCLMAFAAGDREACREAQGNFGENWDATVWRDQGVYFTQVLPWTKE